MQYDESILGHCVNEFAESWKFASAFKPLLGGFIDAMVLVEFKYTGEVRVLLEGPGFEELFGKVTPDDPANFIIRADRQDRENLVSACRMASLRDPSIHVDVAWSVGQGAHAGSGDNFFKTVTGVEHVGHKGDSKLLYFAISDVSERRTREHILTRSRFSSALRALFDEIFLLNLDTGTSEPIYAGGRPLVKEDGSPIDTGFHAMFKTVHRDDTQLFWKCSNYTYVERMLFGADSVDDITFDLRRRDDAGDYHWARVYISRVVSDDNRKYVLVCSQNIDEQKEAQRRERELRSKAQTDGLTGLYNHGTSEELIRAKLQGLRADEMIALAVVDVDNFKRVNDTYGHSMGDELLKVVANAVSGACGDGDVAGRMGGDEFVALFADASGPRAAQLQDCLLSCKTRVLEESAALGIEPPVTLSIGMVAVGADGAVYSEVFDQADQLLYEAKRSGKDSLCISMGQVEAG